jgi:hypothetical protein
MRCQVPSRGRASAVCDEASKPAHARVAIGVVSIELALRPEFLPLARMPPTARSAPRGGERRPSVLTAGPVACFNRRYPPVQLSRLSERACPSRSAVPLATLDTRIDMESSNNSPTSASQQRLLALGRANHIRIARSALKRRLHAGQITPAEAILRGSRDTDTMTVDELLRSQRGWGPKRSSGVLRSVLLSDTKTLGSLTERQRVTLAGILSSRERKKHPSAAVRGSELQVRSRP